MSEVTFPAEVGGDGSTVSDGNDPATGLGNDGHRTRLIPAFSQFVAIAQWVKAKALALSALGTAVEGILAVHNLRKTNLGDVSGEVTLNLATSNWFAMKLVGNTELVLSNVPASTVAASMVLKIEDPGLYTLEFDFPVEWAGGTPPEFDDTPGSIYFLTLVSDVGGASWWGTVSMGGF